MNINRDKEFSFSISCLLFLISRILFGSAAVEFGGTLPVQAKPIALLRSFGTKKEGAINISPLWDEATNIVPLHFQIEFANHKREMENDLSFIVIIPSEPDRRTHNGR